jgi:hypothetical protein
VGGPEADFRDRSIAAQLKPETLVPQRPELQRIVGVQNNVTFEEQGDWSRRNIAALVGGL